MVTVEPDFKEFLELLNEEHVEYLIVGGYALAFCGLPRYTKDLDLFIRPDAGNATRILRALGRFGMGSIGLKENDFCVEDRVVQLGVAPVRIDLITSIPGVSWERAWANKVAVQYGEVPTFVITRADLVTSKRVLGRKVDLADLEALGESS
jgi:hypothetical protein